ncbi:hypothetical protein BOTBODRAFT_511457 [Botryobasidium botryosum FD-172 SS1]|uniref:F-box domain-containing protein n=1 Tax=Botryobasidium botryosum (strain FD-172 SS1) TaxID=930990 RepID=A0A067MS32_BOTB1|nr:hypothetical protein BOTBODRAFT_511457 [Botryobasidium botryosum FD-172 SS1]
MSANAHRITIHRLSAELLLEIFETAAEHFLRFSHVCGLWRRIIHGCSKFWSTIELHVSNDEADQQAAYWLLRAGSSLLSISIRDEEWEGSQRGEDDILVPLANVLRPSMNRCKELSISAWPPVIVNFFQVCASHTSHLAEISVTIPDSFYDVDSEDGRIAPLVIPFTLPPNETFTCASTTVVGWFPIFRSFGATVTELTIDGGASINHADDIMGMFESCPNLIKCSLSGGGEIPLGARSVLQSVSLLHLILLEIEYIAGAGDLLEWLVLPALEVLKVFDPLWEDTIRRALWRLFQSCVSFSKVSIIAGAEDTDTSFEFPGPSLALHSITHFELNSNRVAHSLLKRLTLPNVQELRIQKITADLAHHLASSSPHAHTVSLTAIVGSAGELPIVPLPTLISLRLSGSIELLDHFHLPQLRSLFLNGEVMPEEATRSEKVLLGLIERSAPPLVSLTLAWLRVSDQDLVSCLKALPHLRDLHLFGCTTTDFLLHALSVPFGPANRSIAGCLLPLLKRFEFHKTDLTATAFIAFLLFRNTTRYTEIESDDLPRRLEGKISFDYYTEFSQEDRLKILSLGPYME